MSILLQSLFGGAGRGFGRLHDLVLRGSDPASAKPGSRKHPLASEEPPEDLLQSAAAGECVVFAGEELSRTSGMPTWNTFVLGFIDRLYDTQLLSPEHADVVRAAHRRGECESVAERLTRLALAHRGLLNEYALSLYRKPAALTQLHEVLPGIGACAFVTPNLDLLGERCLGISEALTFTPYEADDALASLLRGEIVAMKLRGVFRNPESLHVWTSEAREANARAAGFPRFLGTILNNRSIVFVAATIDEIESWLQPADVSTRPARKHYAWIPKSGGQPAKRLTALSARFNIQCMTYAAGEVSPAIMFLSKLRPSRERDAVPTSPLKT